MKIALLTWNYPPKKAGGTEIAAQSIARLLASRNHEILVITTRDAGQRKDSLEDGLRVNRVRALKPKFIKYAYFCLQILLTLRGFRPDVIHAQAMWTGLPALMTKRLIGRPYLVWAQGSDIYFPRQFKGLISRLVLRKANAVIALTEDMKREMQKVCSRDIFVIGNGVDAEKFGRLSKEEARNQMGIKKGEKAVIFVGSLVPVKGVRYLIEAMAIVRQANPATRLLIVGDGVEKHNLETLAYRLNLERNVTFCGRLDNEEVPKYLAASDVFVLPSLSEGFPVSIAEAMAAGLPVVTTRVRGLSELVGDGKNGFLVNPENPAQLAEKLLLVLTNDALQAEMSSNNKAWAKLNSWEG